MANFTEFVRNGLDAHASDIVTSHKNGLSDPPNASDAAIAAAPIGNPLTQIISVNHFDVRIGYPSLRANIRSSTFSHVLVTAYIPSLDAF